MNCPLQVRLVIASGSQIIRDGLRRLLESETDLKVVGEASDGAEAVTLVRQLKPDILLLDLAMPKHPALEALRELGAPAGASPVRVILLATAAETSQIVEALQLGARGVVNKDSVTELLLIVKAVRTVVAGEYWEARENKFGLTPRELEVVQCLVQGLTNREIADHIGLSQHTVKNYFFRIFDKLGGSLAAQWFGGPEDPDAAGIAVKKPRSPNLNSGSAAASLDELFG